MTSKHKKHNNLKRYAGYVAGLGIILGVVILISLIVSATSTKLFAFYDPTSGIYLDDYYEEDEIDEMTFVGIEEAFQEDLNAEIAKRSYAALQDYIKYTHPEAKLISYKKNGKSFKNNKLTLAFTVDKEKYKANVNVIDESEFELSINNYNDQVFNYKSADHRDTKRNPLTLLNQYLPASIESGDLAIGIRSTDSKTLQIIANNCGKQEIKDKSIESVKNWLKSIDYDPADFDYTIEDYCDE